MPHDWYVLLCGGAIGAGVACLVFAAVLWRMHWDAVWSRDRRFGN